MNMCRWVALWCALLVAAGAAAAYTVDCNHEYTDCDTELSKLAEDEETSTKKSTGKPTTTTTTTTLPPPTTTTTSQTLKEIPLTERPEPETTEAIEAVKPQPRLLNLNVDELQNFALALHNQTGKSGKKLTDLSDVTLDDEEDEPPRINENQQHNKGINDKFFSNLQAPFHNLMAGKGESSESEVCKENNIGYKIGEKIERGCEETCECTASGVFECSPRCKHPYIRRGRRLNDPLCFESPVDVCCSIIACATGNGDAKLTKLEVCKYNNETYPVGSRWYLGCETTCVCEENSIVTCKPRCKRLPPSDKCINVQDPNDSCCEVQVCDVSEDGHELTADNVTTTTTTPMPPRRSTEDYEEKNASVRRPLVLAEPIGSIKVLQNNTVQVNLMHVNNSEDPIHLLLSEDGGKSFKDVELKYSNLILNLKGGKDYILKTKETGTKFNFTITTMDNPAEVNEVEEHANISKAGCWEDGKFYEVGEEFKIGCSELCECTAPETRECVALVCPNHVGLEIMSKGCVKWAPSPPAQPPNCCPRSARCLSDGTCHYNGVPVPNWSEVPLALTGCEQRCFCENGDLDCQEVCTPLPPVPPQNFRCPPLHRPAAVNISDEDCCKQWGCVPIAGRNKTQTYSMPFLGDVSYVTPITPIFPTTATQVLPTPSMTTDPMTSFFNQLNPFNPHNFVETVTFKSLSNHTDTLNFGDNITVVPLEDNSVPFKPIQALSPMETKIKYWPNLINSKKNLSQDSDMITHTVISKIKHTHPERRVNFILTGNKVQNIPFALQSVESSELTNHDKNKLPFTSSQVLKLSSKLSSLNNYNYFIPTHQKHPETSYPRPNYYIKPVLSSYDPFIKPPSQYFFEPVVTNNSVSVLPISDSISDSSYPLLKPEDHGKPPGKHVTILRTKDMKISKPSNAFDDFWTQNTMTQNVLSKQPSSENLLLRAIQSQETQKFSKPHQKLNTLQVPTKAYNTIDLEHLLNQMEVQSEVNRNLGRSADKNHGPAAGAPSLPADFPPHKSQNPSFLPTVPPDNQYPQEDIPDYDNNIHHPSIPDHPAVIPGLPPGIQVPSSFGDMNKKLSVISIESDSTTSIKMLLGLPPVLVGLRGSVDLRYTDKADEDVSQWYSQVFAPADEVLTTPRLEFRLTGLKPGTTYKVRGKLYLHNLPVSPESDTYTVRTRELPVISPVEEKRREINSGLTVVDVNDTTAHVSWRHFNEDELQFIDGIQVRYRPVGTPIYSMTELLHHSRLAAELHDLRPGSRYEASLVLVPPPRATTELKDPATVEFTTAPYIDPYNWSVIIDVRSVGAEAAELTWHGVPSPAERWVRVYRAAHACGDQTAGKEHDEFKLAARDQPPSVTLSGLEPDTRCRVWLELFLTNGKVKTSNVLEINTKSLDSDNPIDNEVEASGQSANARGRPRGDYYTALVGVGVVAALGALTSFLLLLVVVRRHRPRSVPITPVPTAPRESSLPPYDNPAYKLELQQETMDL